MTKQEPPFFSIVVPVRNQCHKLTLFLFELHHRLESSAQPFEVVVIDDGSRDQTSYVVEKISQQFPTVRIITHSEPLGLGVAARKGILESRGSYILLTRPSLGTESLEILLKNFSSAREGVLLEKVSLKSSLWPPALFLLGLWRIFNWKLSLFLPGGVSARLSPLLFSRSVGAELAQAGRVIHGGYEFEFVFLAKKNKKLVVFRPASRPFTVWSFPFFYFLTVVKEIVRAHIKSFRK
ncbi:MAG: glycosyltransferase family 2 protein [Patescibacteria group bacterium]